MLLLHCLGTKLFEGKEHAYCQEELPEVNNANFAAVHTGLISAVSTEIETETDWDESPLALFKFAMEVFPEMRKHFQMVGKSRKIPPFLTEGI